jgi:hypothetical protein
VTSGGGIYAGPNTALRVEASTVSGNRCDGYYPRGGGIQNLGTTTVVGSTISDNRVYAYLGGGGGIANGGTLTVVGSTLSGNGATASFLESAHALGTYGPSCVVENTVIATNNAVSPAHGATITAYSGNLVLSNCTVAFNEPTANYGCLRATGSVLVENSIFRGNTGAEITGSGVTVNFSCIEGGWSGSGVGNIDEAPLFANPALGRYDLQPGSPCVDAGDPSAVPQGTDSNGNPRLLDGDLDGSMAVDMGAYEYDNVRLAVTGRTWHDLTLRTTGRGGLALFLVAGRRPGEALLPPWGSTLFAPSSLWFVVPLGTTPANGRLGVPRDASVLATDVTLQALVLGAPKGRGSPPGNFSNAVRLALD